MYRNGEYVELTAEEQAMLAEQPSAPSVPTLEERLAALEAKQERLLSKLQAFLAV